MAFTNINSFYFTNSFIMPGTGRTRNNKPADEIKEDAPEQTADTVDRFQVILDKIDTMKDELIEDRVNKDRVILKKITDLENSLTTRVNEHDVKITNLEAYRAQAQDDFGELKHEMEDLRDNYSKLSEKLLDAVSHSRRLNLHFLNFKEEEEENVIARIRKFCIEVLDLPEAIVNAFIFRDAHRMGTKKAKSKYPRPIIAGFVLMEHRNAIYRKAYKCKNSGFAIRVDLPPELVPVRRSHVDLKSEILKVNPTALASCSFKGYKPVLLVKFNGKVQEYSTIMQFKDLQPGDKR